METHQDLDEEGERERERLCTAQAPQACQGCKHLINTCSVGESRGTVTGGWQRALSPRDQALAHASLSAVSGSCFSNTDPSELPPSPGIGTQLGSRPEGPELNSGDRLPPPLEDAKNGRWRFPCENPRLFLLRRKPSPRSLPVSFSGRRVLAFGVPKVVGVGLRGQAGNGTVTGSRECGRLR